MILAAADNSDPDHERCRLLLEGHPGPLVTTCLVVAEAGWLIDRQLGARAEARFLRSVAEGDLAVVDLATADWRRVVELVETYSDLPLGGVDASLVAIAEKLRATELASLDRRDFSVVRTKHADALSLLP